MRVSKLALLLLTMSGCTASGTRSSPGDAGSAAGGGDATIDAPANGAGGPSASDSGRPPCTDYDAATISPSYDCVYAGTCPLDCLGSTASEYACNAGNLDASAMITPPYPAVFTVPSGTVHIFASQATTYPWGTAAFLSCAPLACVRWAFADHGPGGSAWSADPCGGDAGSAVQAWSCPQSPGVAPPVDGCTNAGPMQVIGGGEAGVSESAVWCCPPAPGTGGTGGLDAGAGDAGGDGGDAGGGMDASTVDGGDAMIDGGSSDDAAGGDGSDASGDDANPE